MIINGILVYFSTRSSLQKLSIERLTSLRETKKQQIEDYFSLITKITITYSEDQVISSALRDFSEPKNKTSIQNSERYRSYFQNISNRFNIEDILLVNSKSNDVVFTLKKLKDYKINLKSIDESPMLKTAYTNSLTSSENPSASITDFSYYKYDSLKPSAFLSASIFNSGERIGVLIFRISIDYINQIMTNDENWEVSGLGKTLETYIVGPDYKMQTIPDFLYKILPIT